MNESAGDKPLPEELSGPGSAQWQADAPGSDLGLFEQAVRGLAGDPNHELNGLRAIELLEKILEMLSETRGPASAAHTCPPTRRTGALASCGCWYHALPGQGQADVVRCPIHSWAQLVTVNREEPYADWVNTLFPSERPSPSPRAS